MNGTESLRARIASLEAELASHYKRRAAIEAMEACKTYATTHAQEIADEGAQALNLYDKSIKGMCSPSDFPRLSNYLELRNEADRLRKEVQP